MKTLLIILVAAGAGFAAGYFVVGARPQPAASVIIVQTNAPKKALRLEVPLRRKMASSTNATLATAPAVVGGLDPRELLQRLEQTMLRPGPEQSQSIRRVIQLFEDLSDCGPAALPAIRDFLAKNMEFDYEENTDEIRSGWRDGEMTTDFLLPPSLRLGLLRTVQRIGGNDAEQILVEVLTSTGRGVEVAYVTRLLEEVAPQKYKEPAITAAHELLTHPVVTGKTGRLDGRDQDWLFGVLRLYQDITFAQQAQARLVREDGSVDSTVLGYLSSSLQGKSVPMLTLAYQDNRLTNNGARFQIAYAAARYVGAEAAADQFLQAVLDNTKTSGDTMSELIRSLSERGLENRREPTELDLQILASRQALLENFMASHPQFKRTEDLRKTIRRIAEMRAPPQQKPDGDRRRPNS